MRVKTIPTLLVLTVLPVLKSAVAAAAASNPTLPPGLEMIRRTERAFAKATSELGFRNGFLMFFADDAIAPPDPGPARAGLLSIPAPVEPRPTDLVWEPLFGDIARSGDLGYLTGPSSFTGREGKKHTGVYFSIWRRGADGLWLVVVDAGVDMPSPAAEFAAGTFRAAPAAAWKGPAARDSLAALESLKQAEREFTAAAEADAKAAYRSWLAPDSRLHREGRHPLLGRDAIVAAIGSEPPARDHQPVRAAISSGEDLGWTFDTCKIAAADSTKRGGSTRVWRRDEQGRWRIVLDVLVPERR
jgi:ketosteroid isomerase-like protein